MKPMDDLDAKLDSLLRALPRERASAHLAPRVLARVRRPRATRYGGRYQALAVATAIGLVVVAMLALAPQVLDRSTSPGHGIARDGVASKRPSERSIQTLETEYRQLRDELTALQRLHAAARPMVYLGGTERADFVLDLERLARRRSRGWPSQHSPAHDSQARRAAYSTGGSIP
jgi:hypothetical protein